MLYAGERDAQNRNVNYLVNETMEAEDVAQ